ncbi:MAG: hypothetical protein AB1752_12855 [Candidatus Zixiibacteriota bacterium]
MTNGPQINFKNPRLAEEWGQVHPELRRMVYELARFALSDLGRAGLVITCLWRSEDEQRAAYRVPPGAPVPNPKSLHLSRPVRAVDVRRSMFSDRHVEMLHAYWDSIRPAPGYDFVDEPAKLHIHLEIDHKADAHLATLENEGTNA